MKGVKQCKTCQFYDKVCKRYPTYVERKPTDYCGEYLAMDKAQAIANLVRGANAND